MNPNRGEDDVKSGLPLLTALKTFWGITAILGLAGYSLLHSLDDQSVAAGVVAQTSLPEAVPTALPRVKGPVVIGNVTMYPFVAQEPSAIVHLACDAEEARLVRTYDAPPAGRGIVLRLDQSAADMKLLYQRGDPRFPGDTRIITTPCIQGMIDRGEFP
jgi:hypothetical protein